METAYDQEFRHLNAGMHVVAVTEAEAAIIRRHHNGPVTVLGRAIAPSPTPRRFDDRAGILFVGAIHDTDHPNYDGLAWFIDEVLPLIEQTLRWETRLTVAGYIAPGVTLDRFTGHPRVTMRGTVTTSRRYIIVIAYSSPRRDSPLAYPTRCMRLPRLVPVVATTLLPSTGLARRRCKWSRRRYRSPGFAARVIALHRDPIFGCAYASSSGPRRGRTKARSFLSRGRLAKAGREQKGSGCR